MCCCLRPLWYFPFFIFVFALCEGKNEKQEEKQYHSAAGDDGVEYATGVTPVIIEMLETTDQRLRQREFLLRVSRAITAQLDLSSVLDLVVDVAVDLRAGSPSYGKHVSAVLSAENWTQIWVPPGFAHGFLTLEPDTEAHYKVAGGEYAAKLEGGLAWNDPALAIAWPAEPKILSEHDRNWPLLANFVTPFGAAA